MNNIAPIIYTIALENKIIDSKIVLFSIAIGLINSLKYSNNNKKRLKRIK